MIVKSKYVYTPDVGVTFSDDGCRTVQDDCLSIREILCRFSNGQPLPDIQMNPQYPQQERDLEDPWADVDWNDLISVQEYQEKVNARCDELKAQRQHYEDLVRQQQESQQESQQQKQEQ